MNEKYVVMTLKIHEKNFRKLESLLKYEMFERVNPRFKDMHSLINILLSRGLALGLDKDLRYKKIKMLVDLEL